MFRRLSLLLGSSAVAATLSLRAPANGQECCPDNAPVVLPHVKVLYFPYYSPVIPVCKRWYSTDWHGNEFLVPYYRGYTRWSPRFKNCPNPFAPCCPPPPPPGCGAGAILGTYGVYTGARHDEESLLHLGGMGFSHPSPEGAPADFIDIIKGNCGPGGFAPPPLPGPAVSDKKEGGTSDKKEGETPSKKYGSMPPPTR